MGSWNAFVLAVAAHQFRRGRSSKAYLPESVLAECIFILTKFYKVPKEEAAARLGELLDRQPLAHPDAGSGDLRR
jgi:predicted nucleic-acid-binding protein